MHTPTLCRGRDAQAPGVDRVVAGGHGRGGHRRPGAVGTPSPACRPTSATARDHARSANDCLARVVAEHPDGLPMRHASATPCSRCRTACLSRVVQTSVLPRLASASARRSWPGWVTVACFTVPVPLRRIQRSVRQLIRRELGIGPPRELGRNPVSSS